MLPYRETRHITFRFVDGGVAEVTSRVGTNAWGLKPIRRKLTSTYVDFLRVVSTFGWGQSLIDLLRSGLPR